MTETASRELARITRVETAAERTGTDGIGELADLAPAASAALNLLTDAIKRGRADQDSIVEALKAARIDEAFAGVLDAAADAVMTAADDPYDLHDRLHADNLGGAASDIRRAFHWL
ncbi:hypothetical protein NW249_23705 [Streptomyces sp. OUCMDZ-4982]|uniref:hypothetical protein n=1 Tax=Streptomyces sp. OUCMDZ-4982 TaxID=2973090 RepID=UPI00215D1E23|nr:hypothetical protein [Streptomyces sp. OUCMDZ-4982]MCR8945127.1 hypothetical protein [Streptomyces sp. OUCMDZ-4982]